jgi:exopolyphosphatase/pppGpp-phosphohydrolase
MTTQPGAVTIGLNDRTVDVSLVGGRTFELPIGPLALLDGPLERADVPAPELLTNAIGLVHDHIDDVLIEAPSLAAAVSVTATGPHAVALARVELGTDDVPADYRLERADADDVFRTIVVEPVDDRRHNPGLADSHVESIIGTCCVILGIMRRLDLRHIDIRSGNDDAAVSGPVGDG